MIFYVGKNCMLTTNEMMVLNLCTCGLLRELVLHSLNSFVRGSHGKSLVLKNLFLLNFRGALYGVASQVL